jgi:hypothetical protein
VLLADDFYEDAVGEIAFKEVNYAAFDVAFEDLARGFDGRGWLIPRSLSRDRGHTIFGGCRKLPVGARGLLTG